MCWASIPPATLTPWRGDGDRVLADVTFPARTDSLEQIVDNIDSTLKRAGLTLKDVEGIGVGLGPGSWTGIKVGVTVGKMLAFSTGKPVAGIPTLEALAYGARKESRHDLCRHQRRHQRHRLRRLLSRSGE